MNGFAFFVFFLLTWLEKGLYWRGGVVEMFSGWHSKLSRFSSLKRCAGNCVDACWMVSFTHLADVDLFCSVSYLY